MIRRPPRSTLFPYNDALPISRKLFVLMLLDRERPPTTGNGDNLLHRSVAAILSSIRETDIAGWHKENSALGVIFAELGEGDKKSILPALRAKVTSALRSIPHTEELDQIRIPFHCFPADRGDHHA